MGNDTIDSWSSGAKGTINTNGAIDLLARGITIGDIVEVYDSSTGVLKSTATVLQSPSDANTVVTDNTVTLASNDVMRFLCGRKDQQAVMFNAIGAGIHNRRVKAICPGWFNATFGNTNVIVPPYYVAAARCGLDCGQIVSQSMTNNPFTIPGLSNYDLQTNFYWRKEQLDEIGGGGVDIQVQDVEISQSIKSRHDLTTNMDAVELMLWSITKQADVCAKTLRNAVSPYIGKCNIGPALFRFLGQVCNVVCDKLMKAPAIVSKISVDKIERDANVTNKINFYVSATVFVEGDYYDITLLVKSR